MIEKEKLLNISKQICGIDNFEQQGNVDLFENGLLDSLGVIELLVQIEEQFGIKIEPTELERDEISTTNKIMEYLNKRSE